MGTLCNTWCCLCTKGKTKAAYPPHSDFTFYRLIVRAVNEEKGNCVCAASVKFSICADIIENFRKTPVVKAAVKAH